MKPCGIGDLAWLDPARNYDDRRSAKAKELGSCDPS
jgi:hypothetical protein